MSLQKASKKYNVPKSTLHDHVTEKVKERAVYEKTPVLTADEEKQLLKSATERAEMGVGFSKRNFLRAARALARKGGGGGHLKMVHLGEMVDAVQKEEWR